MVFKILESKELYEQYGRKYYKSFSKPDISTSFCSKENYCLTLMPSTEEGLKKGYWKGTPGERTEYLKEYFIVPCLFGKWIDHWDCIKGGMVQPFRVSRIMQRQNFTFMNGGIFTKDEINDPDLRRRFGTMKVLYSSNKR